MVFILRAEGSEKYSLDFLELCCGRELKVESLQRSEFS